MLEEGKIDDIGVYLAFLDRNLEPLAPINKPAVNNKAYASGEKK